MILISNFQKLWSKNRIINNFENKLQLIKYYSNVNDKKPYNHYYEEKKRTFRRVFSMSQSMEERKECVLAEIELCKEEGIRMPKNLTEDNWKMLLNEPTRVYKNLLYLSKKEHAKEKQKQKVETIKKNKLLNEISNNPITTSYPGHNTFIKHTSTSYSKQFLNYLINAYRFNDPAIVFDFQFENQIHNEHILRTLLQQLVGSYGANCKSKNPFRMYFANLHENGKFSEGMKKRNINLDELMVVNSEKSYLDLFPKEKLVYLSPNAKYNMKDIDEDKIYIIGVLADGGSSYEKLTYYQAQKEGIRCERLPFEKYVNWGSSQKELTLNCVVNILLSQREDKNWKKSLSDNLPKRKLKQNNKNFDDDDEL